MSAAVSVFAPGSVGNVGPGFDVLGLAVDGIGDTVSLELTDGADEIVEVKGRDADALPRDPRRNSAGIAARALLDSVGATGRHFRIWLGKGLAMSGGMGGSAASAVAGALAAESAVAGRHLDNIAPCVLGGLALVRSTDPVDVIPIALKDHWWVALLTPHIRIETRSARAILPAAWERSEWVQQMANTTALVHAFATGDGELVKRALDDRYAEPRRAQLIPNFAEMKAAALARGAFGCSISGSGPTLFALTSGLADARACANAMQKALGQVPSTAHVGRVAIEGARAL